MKIKNLNHLECFEIKTDTVTYIRLCGSDNISIWYLKDVSNTLNLILDSEIYEKKYQKYIKTQSNNVTNKIPIENDSIHTKIIESIFDNITEIKQSKRYDDIDFYMIDSKLFIEYNKETNDINIRFNDFCSQLYEKGYNYEKIKDLFKPELEKFLKCKINYLRIYSDEYIQELEEKLRKPQNKNIFNKICDLF